MRKIRMVKMPHNESNVPDWAALNPGIFLIDAVYRYEHEGIAGRQSAFHPGPYEAHITPA
jgi:hypothetical protein